jgi:hypothetical protein
MSMFNLLPFPCLVISGILFVFRSSRYFFAVVSTATAVVVSAQHLVVSTQTVVESTTGAVSVGADDVHPDNAITNVKIVKIVFILLFWFNFVE